MSIKFNIQETVETELFYGVYCIYILGGHQVSCPEIGLHKSVKYRK